MVSYNVLTKLFFIFSGGLVFFFFEFFLNHFNYYPTKLLYYITFYFIKNHPSLFLLFNFFLSTASFSYSFPSKSHLTFYSKGAPSVFFLSLKSSPCPGYCSSTLLYSTSNLLPSLPSPLHAPPPLGSRLLHVFFYRRSNASAYPSFTPRYSFFPSFTLR
ncbi:dubious [Schizosaccharomyces pombe]|uniref:Uncharacterized transmembrane protein C343.21 n=1 Tax=Schizosaccharomyces pombe (strain 972 / ATCC 24843) TaxID=284812 RepID=YIP21_SCHPO|nr:uncharacterized protein SPAC343.21 [Schizosaccharomyces pombe]G2TRK0.1 RecName: Full=Uncharacterized transmembrane protein C343.21 [Schizosaccharomyces pombe 972h-]CCD31311.1 sequence orphan [Schizosaccharomyces pombe]|eukprot:NP_001343101.1 uncharacterized protein SPAC343.21 [Schizosaccharomyces pombe]